MLNALANLFAVRVMKRWLSCKHSVNGNSDCPYFRFERSPKLKVDHFRTLEVGSSANRVPSLIKRGQLYSIPKVNQFALHKRLIVEENISWADIPVQHPVLSEFDHRT